MDNCETSSQNVSKTISRLSNSSCYFHNVYVVFLIGLHIAFGKLNSDVQQRKTWTKCVVVCIKRDLIWNYVLVEENSCCQLIS